MTVLQREGAWTAQPQFASHLEMLLDGSDEQVPHALMNRVAVTFPEIVPGEPSVLVGCAGVKLNPDDLEREVGFQRFGACSA